MTGNFSVREYAFFSAVGVLLFLFGQAGLPVAHYFYDAVAIRDTGTFMASLATDPYALSTFVTLAFSHHEGSIQFLLLNLYCFLVGDSWPLNPSTMQLPNTVLAVFAAVFCFLIAKKLLGIRFAYCSAAVFVLGPWLAFTIRLPWYFDTLSCLLHFSTMYFFVSLMYDPQSGFYRVAAPISLSLYLLTGLDWPCFIPCLLFFVLVSRQTAGFAKNPYFLLPVLTVLVLGVWQVIVYLKLGKPTLGYSRLIYPFWSFLNYIKFNSWSSIWNSVILPWGPQMLLAGAGGLLYVFTKRKLWLNDRVRSGLFDTMCLWLVISAPALFISAGSATYLYVLAMPSAILSGLALAQMRKALVVTCVLALAISQVYFVTDKQFAFQGDQKQRVLAAASYLIEQRPDLLVDGRTAVVAGFDSAAALQYARPRSIGVIVGVDFPVRYESVRNYCMATGACSVVDLAGQQRRIVHPWFIVDTSLLSEKNTLRAYWFKLLQEPHIRWIAQFRESTGDVIYIGEPAPGPNGSAYEAPTIDVAKLSQYYSEKYDRLSFLKKNLEYVYHY